MESDAEQQRQQLNTESLFKETLTFPSCNSVHPRDDSIQPFMPDTDKVHLPTQIFYLCCFFSTYTPMMFL